MQRLEVGIMAVFPLAFTLVVDVILQAFLCVVGGQRRRPGLRLPLVRDSPHDLTTLTYDQDLHSRAVGKASEEHQVGWHDGQVEQVSSLRNREPEF